MKPEIIITVALDGSTTVETIGYKGKSCQDASKAIEIALGKKQSETLKPEFYQSGNTGQQLQNKV